MVTRKWLNSLIYKNSTNIISAMDLPFHVCSSKQRGSDPDGGSMELTREESGSARSCPCTGRGRTQSGRLKAEEPGLDRAIIASLLLNMGP